MSAASTTSNSRRMMSRTRQSDCRCASALSTSLRSSTPARRPCCPPSTTGKSCCEPASRGKGGGGVEDPQGDVRQQGPLEERTAGRGGRGERAQCLRQGEPGVECRGDDHIQGGARQRHPNLLTRIVRYALESRHAPDGQQGDIAGANAVAPGRERVAELVPNDAGEQGKDENDPRQRRRAAAREPVRDP